MLVRKSEVLFNENNQDLRPCIKQLLSQIKVNVSVNHYM